MNYSFWAAAAAIAVVDIVLSSDNAIVIGAAASRLHGSRRVIAILFGGLGAIVLRLALASVATTLLLVPYLRFIGGVTVFIIGIRLLLPESERDRGLARGGLLAAMLTIIIADFTMSIDNVIAVGALADGNVLLLVAGITFSMVLLFVASSVIARLVESMQWLLDVAAVVLAWTAANLILSDPALVRMVHLSDRLQSALHYYAVALVLVADLIIRAVLRHRARHQAVISRGNDATSGPEPGVPVAGVPAAPSGTVSEEGSNVTDPSLRAAPSHSRHPAPIQRPPK
jgi:YjbE family integral membrane protein